MSNPRLHLPGLFLCAGLLPAFAGPARAQTVAAPEDAARALHLLSRATWGVRPLDVDAILAIGTDAWLDLQLHPGRIPDDGLTARLAPFARLDGPPAELYDAFPPPQELARQLAERHGIDPERLGEPGGRAALPREARRELVERSPRRLFEELAATRLIRSVHSERQLEAVMTEFWFNHFNVHAGKQLTRFLVADYEREAIRPHVFGRFEDMLAATARHPAMLFYLDNWTSVAADSMRAADADPRAAQLRRLAQLDEVQKERLVRQGRITREQLRRIEETAPMLEQAQRRMRGRGLNENYARELLELHTLGVDGGYDQTDVVDVARAFTGWSMIPFARPAGGRTGPIARIEPGTFAFNAAGHDRGAKTVLGAPLTATGMDEGREVLHRLATHPSTARFLSTKLIERFVSDTPDPAFVEELARVWTRTDGDLREVTRALFTSPRFHDPAVRGAKVKTPFELVASALRVTHADAALSRRLFDTLRSMGHMPYDAAAPTGYPAASEDWVNSGAMLARMNFALDLAAGRVDGVRPAHAVLAAGDAPDAVLRQVLPGVATEALAGIIREDLAAEGAPADAAGRARRALGLALGSPEFQKR